MTDAPQTRGIPADVVRRELAAEQAHIDRVYAELAKAADRAALVEADGLSRGRAERTGDLREEELAGLFERDALVHNASRRQLDLERQYEGLVFGRLDMAHPAPGAPGGPAVSEREVRYVGRLGVRDDDYEPLVVDWRAPAAAPFYRATPGDPGGVLRRRVLRCKGPVVVGAEDDLMAAEAPEDLVILGEGALMAALSRSRDGQMRDIVATIQAHQDVAIRAPARGVTEITGGPGTGKTVVALHRAAYLLYSDRRRFESGGVLVVGPSPAYTAYIERVLPSLGEDSVVLRSLGDVVEVTSTHRHDPAPVARTKGALRMRRVLQRAARDIPPGAPSELRLFVAGRPVRLSGHVLEQCRARALRAHRRNSSTPALRAALADAAWGQDPHGDPDDFRARFLDHEALDRFVNEWWRPVDPREVLLWLGDPDRTRRYTRGLLSTAEADALAESIRQVWLTGLWSVADVALIDELSTILGLLPEQPRERGFYQVEDLDDVLAEVVGLGHLRAQPAADPRAGTPTEPAADAPAALLAQLPDTQAAARTWDRLLRGRLDTPGEYAHILVDEAQDLSPMQWRMLGRRGRWASWTVVGDTAQASWPDLAEAEQAKLDAFGAKPRSGFRMTTNYRNSREIFEHAAAMIRQVLPDADIPEAVRRTGVAPTEQTVAASEVATAAGTAVDRLTGQVAGSVAVIAPSEWSGALQPLAGRGDGRVLVMDPLDSKGLEFDATLVVDPDGIEREMPGGPRGLYVVLTRAAHRMHVLRVATS